LAGEGTEAIVPPRALNQVVKLMSGGSELKRVLFGQSHVMFDLDGVEEGSDVGGARLFSRLIEGPYVDYDQVIPRENAKRLEVAYGTFAPAVRRVSILASSQTHQVRLKVSPNEVELSATSQEIGGEAREAMEADYQDEEMTIGYNSSYLMDLLRRIDSERLVFELDSPVTAAILRPAPQPEDEDYLCLVMPLRLGE
jgi:DNA polymerase-3 subunit beta